MYPVVHRPGTYVLWVSGPGAKVTIPRKKEAKNNILISLLKHAETLTDTTIKKDVMSFLRRRLNEDYGKIPEPEEIHVRGFYFI
jgi:hypothetical protein